MEILTYVLIGVLVLTSIFLTLLILMHKGKGGGMSDMFGGGVSNTLGGSSVAERNLDRSTVAFAITWACMGLIQLVTRFQKHTRGRR